MIAGKNANLQNKKGHGHPCTEEEPWRAVITSVLSQVGKQDFVDREKACPRQRSVCVSDETLHSKWVLWREKQVEAKAKQGLLGEEKPHKST